MSDAEKLSRLATPAADEADRAVVGEILAYWSAQDVEQTVSLMSDDIVYQLSICRSAMPFGAARSGRPAVRTVLYDLLADFDYLYYEPVVLDVCRGVARIQTQYGLRHRVTGEDLSGSKRVVCYLQRGLVTRIHEYHDVPLVEAFVQLTKWRLAELALSGRTGGSDGHLKRVSPHDWCQKP